ncbi:hypothetical protein CEE37_14370 [candidate division LCP-89 bacterium B3_LCP]|uniref:Collagen-like protein n=1 Tax=candidate division LCP-89 bacterium B3_LCP TaxID=2012998 RepID=A0A532UQ20_UNCL8|nr:MAG: hypothetical protein CEE37_14370 [candidate division LCP-89 bacterium B3_LCP]
MNAIKFTFVTIIIISIILTGCDGPQGPTGEVGPQGAQGPSDIFITGTIKTATNWNAVGNVFITTSNTQSVPEVSLNGISIPMQLGEIGFLFTHDDFPVTAGDTVQLVVDYIDMNSNPSIAGTEAILPDSFGIALPNPANEVILVVGDSLTINWSPSPGVDTYSLEFMLEYSYLDTLGSQEYFQYGLDTTLIDTVINFTSDILFPDAASIDSVLVSSGHFDVWAVAGPVLEGDESNITGEGEGFFYAWTFGSHLELTVQDPP